MRFDSATFDGVVFNPSVEIFMVTVGEGTLIVRPEYVGVWPNGAGYFLIDAGGAMVSGEICNDGSLEFDDFVRADEMGDYFSRMTAGDEGGFSLVLTPAYRQGHDG